MAFISPKFEDLRIVICSNGFKLDCDYILREIGFSYENVSGSIPFNCRLNRYKIEATSQFIIDYLENEVHGIKFNKKVDHGLLASECISVLKSLYHLNTTTSAKYIGISSQDEGIKALLYKAGLGQYIIDLNNIDVVKNNSPIPSDGELMVIQQNEITCNPCSIHDRLKSFYKPLCAKTKAEYLFNFCKSLNQH